MTKPVLHIGKGSHNGGVVTLCGLNAGDSTRQSKWRNGVDFWIDLSQYWGHYGEQKYDICPACEEHPDLPLWALGEL